MPRVLLIRPNCDEAETEFAEPLGLERLAGYLRAHGIERVDIADRRLCAAEQQRGIEVPPFWHAVRFTYAHGSPTHVGLSLMTSSDLPDALRIVSRLRAYYPHALFCAGGVFVTTSPSEVRRCLPSCVHLIPNEGEAQLLAWIRGHGDTDSVACPNDWSPAYRPDLLRYAALGCAVNLQSSRGCPGSCAFCATPNLPEPYRTWQPRDLRLVVNEMACESARLRQAGLPPIFNFVDDDFGPLARVEELGRELRRQDVRVAFALEMRMASLVGQHRLAERLRALRHLGLTRVFVGVESLNAQTLRKWRKAYDTARLPDVIQAFRHTGITLQAGYILWHKGQTVEGATYEVERLWQLGIYSHRAAMSRLIAFRGCDLSPSDAELGEVERFYNAFATHANDLTQRWTDAAIKEPYAAAVSHLTGDGTGLGELQTTLSKANEESYELFLELAHSQGIT